MQCLTLFQAKPASVRQADVQRASVAARATTDSPSVEAVTDALQKASSSNRQAAADARAFRRQLNRTSTYQRQTTNDPASLKKIDADGVGYSTSGLVAQMRAAGNMWQQGEVTVHLAQYYGFCWGVERAVQMAYEARQAYPDRKLHITNEIIHNPSVNNRMREMEVEFIEVKDGAKDFSRVQAGEVVILPAFGASVEEMRLLHERNVQIVDTTCPWVAKVWNAVDKQAAKAHTSIIHGKYSHEETVATASFAGDYVIVKDRAEAEYVANYILNGGDRDEFLKKFEFATSKGFDPDTMLDNVGIANQTTMLKGETEGIGKLMEQTMMKKYGPAEFSQHFMIMDTICDATQERQDAMYQLTDGSRKVDMIMVVGGFNSSNTSHLQEIAEHKGIPSFWVSSPDNIDVAANKITHKTSWGELRETSDWLKREGPLVVGVTSGASTPDRDVEMVLERIFQIKDPSFTGIEPKVVAAPARPEAEHE